MRGKVLFEIQEAAEQLYGEGYNDALLDIVEFIQSRLGSTLVEREPESTSEPTSEPVDDAPPTGAEASNGVEPPSASAAEAEAFTTALSQATPAIRLAYERLRASPGMTSREMRDQHGGSAGVLYALERQGLARKDGNRFFAIVGESAVIEED